MTLEHVEGPRKQNDGVRPRDTGANHNSQTRSRSIIMLDYNPKYELNIHESY